MKRLNGKFLLTGEEKTIHKLKIRVYSSLQCSELFPFVETMDGSFYRLNAIRPSVPNHCPTSRISNYTSRNRKCVWWESGLIVDNDAFWPRRNDFVLDTLWLRTVGRTASSVHWYISWGQKQPHTLRCTAVRSVDFITCGNRNNHYLFCSLGVTVSKERRQKCSTYVLETL